MQLILMPWLSASAGQSSTAVGGDAGHARPQPDAADIVAHEVPPRSDC